MGTAWAATEVGLRRVKAGLGGHDAGVSGGDEGVEKASITVLKRDELHGQITSHSVVLE